MQIVLNEAFSIGVEKVGMIGSLNRVLAEEVVSDVHMPPFNKSAMDGFACSREDLRKELEIIETVAAGELPQRSVGPGQCTRIMTGARVPEGADCVIKVEETETRPNGKIVFMAEKSKHNIAFEGEDVKIGDVVIEKGTRIRPQHIAIMASVGQTNPLVSKKPVVGIISTGNEIVEPDTRPGPSQIRNSNGYQLLAQVLRQGSAPEYLGIARDDEETTFQILKKALHKFDVILLSGGVSMGDFDFIPKVFKRLKLDLKFKTIAMQPGKPTVLAISEDNKIVFGLPGNPVSSYNTFELFVRPLLNKMMGENLPYRRSRFRMGTGYTRKRAARISWIPVKISEDGLVFPLEYHGSAHISSLTEADAFAAVPIGVLALKKGDHVDIRYI
ncbi:MAG: molybdopterin molybdotransferase MoeA [Desulfobacteraceae bacterium]|nr:molybdopterin molybdotransferase MoeA [Desulfobacteraceae bacterium]